MTSRSRSGGPDRSTSRHRRLDLLSLGAVIALAVAVVIAVDPRGLFPLNDDWCYAQAVRTLLTRGEVRPVDWGSPSLLTQLLWGAGFASIWGFSFDVLRASTLVLGLSSLLSLRGIVRGLGASPATATLAAVALLGTPIFVLLAHTFMTDVPFLGFSLASLALLQRGIASDSRLATAGGLALAIAATFVRQLGLAILIGFAVAMLVRGWRQWGRWLIAWTPLAAGLLLLRGYESWLASRNALPGAYHHQWSTIRQRFEEGVVDYFAFGLTNARNMAIEVGLFATPLAALWLLRSWSTHGRRRVIVIGAATIGAALLAWRGHLAPYFSNLVLDVGCSLPRQSAGPLTLRDGCLSNEPGLGLVRFGPRVALTWIGLVGFGCVVVAAFEVWRAARGAGGERQYHGAQTSAPVHDAPERLRSSIALLLATATSYAIVIASIDVFDRYLLFLVPFALALLGAAIRVQPGRTHAAAWITGGALALGSMLWTVGAVQEYLDWNRARWRAIAYLASDLGARREEIDGGFEYGGWVNFDARFRNDRRGTSWWWVVDDYYAVAFAPIDGFVVLRSFPYRGWFGLVENDIVALARTTNRSARR